MNEDSVIIMSRENTINLMKEVELFARKNNLELHHENILDAWLVTIQNKAVDDYLKKYDTDIRP